MRHLKRVSSLRTNRLCEVGPHEADAKGDLLNALARAWSDFLYAKKNEVV
jgi:hypothetical protein